MKMHFGPIPTFNPTHDADEWDEFKYDLDTKTLIGGSYYSFENKNLGGKYGNRKICLSLLWLQDIWIYQ